MDAPEMLRLFLALALPWATGAVWLYRWNPLATPARLSASLGFGYFLGMLICISLLRLAYAFELPPFPATIAGLMLLTAGALAVDKRPASPPTGKTPKPNKLFILLLLLVTLAHLLPTLLETLVRPVYPWDAWTTWVYRAKIWFMNGELLTFVPPGSTAADAYELKAWDYPLFASITHLWPALALGRWSETLVNLPDWISGVALAISLYAMARTLFDSTIVPFMTALLFLSIPIVDAHMLLPGYADLWMAGYAGLGLALLVMAPNRPTLFFGILLLASAPLIKKEGIVWVLAGLSYLGLRYRLATTLFMLSTTLLTAIAIVALDHPLPLIGPVSHHEGVLTFGTLSEWKFQYHANVLPAFLEAFYYQGSWNLFWVVIAVALVSGIVQWKKSDSKKAVILSGILTAALFVIFFLSPESRWARDLTAINRLPLQILPALLMSILLIWKDSIPTRHP